MIGVLIRTLIARLLLFIVIAIWFIPTLIIFCIPARWRFGSRFVYMLIHGFYVAVLKSTLVPIIYKGTENIPDQPVIFAANHQSSLDIPLVGRLTKGIPHIWLARHELLESFFLRIVLPRFAVVVHVDEPIKAMRSLLRIINLVKDKHRHLMIFPEGSRFTDDRVHEFFGGFVILAKKLKRPIVPVRIFNANKVYPPNTFLVRWHPIVVVVGKPFMIGQDESDAAFKQRVYQWFVEQKEG